jgi:hypothetical protein
MLLLHFQSRAIVSETCVQCSGSVTDLRQTEVTGLTTGEHTLYIQSTAADGEQVEFPFTVK